MCHGCWYRLTIGDDCTYHFAAIGVIEACYYDDASVL